MKPSTCNRRQALQTIAAGAAAGAALPLLKSRAADSRPNIVFILTDDQRYDAFGFMNNPWLKTPNMDRLAREGVHFKNSFVTTSLCSPSRASLLTGQYPRCHGVVNNLTPWDPKNVTFLELLRGQGYQTAFIGKWNMPGKDIPDLTGAGKVDRMVSFSAGLGQGVYQDCPLIVDGKDVKGPGYITDVLTQYALEFLNQRRSGPFCLYLSHKAPHNNFIPPDRYKGKLAQAPLRKMEEQTHNYLMGAILLPQLFNFDKDQQGYYETIMGVDDSVGAVLKLLDDKGWAENTLIVYGSDNGYLWGEHGLIDKRLAYEESIRVPHLLRWPRRAPKGGMKVEQMVLNIDLMPTLLTAAEVPIPSWVQGQNYLGFLDPAQHLPGRASWLYEYRQDPGFPPDSSIKAVRTPDWKFVTYPGAKDPLFKDELFHLADDPRERKNLAADPAWAKKKSELAAELARLDREITCPAR
jgi:arylsulfatase A-like enzyme